MTTVIECATPETIATAHVILNAMASEIQKTIDGFKDSQDALTNLQLIVLEESLSVCIGTLPYTNKVPTDKQYCELCDKFNRWKGQYIMLAKFLQKIQKGQPSEESCFLLGLEGTEEFFEKTLAYIRSTM